MQPREIISKSSWVFVENIKDRVATNLAKALQSNQIKVDKAQLDRMINITLASIDEGYHSAHKPFISSVDKVLTAVADDATESAKKK